MPSHPDRKPLVIRFKNSDEQKRLKRAAEKEGFNSLAAWIMYHIRQQATKTLGEEPEPEQK